MLRDPEGLATRGALSVVLVGGGHAPRAGQVGEIRKPDGGGSDRIRASPGEDKRDEEADDNYCFKHGVEARDAKDDFRGFTSGFAI